MVDFKDFKKKVVVELNKGLSGASVELPSNGHKALIRPMKIKEQKDFLKALEKKDEYLINECFDQILTACVETINSEPYDNDSICIQDRAYLLLKIRELTTGPEAKITHVCPKSEEVVENILVDISKFPVVKHQGNINQVIKLTENVKIVLGAMTRRSEKDIESWQKENNKEGSIVDKRYCAYAGILKEVWIKEDGKDYEPVLPLSFANKLDFIVGCCSQSHLDQMDEYIKSLDFGIKAKFHFKSKVYENTEEEANIISFFII